MNALSILLAQSVAGPVIEIVLLLLVAGLIGYLTAWFYAKSVYTPIIRSLEEDKKELSRQISGLTDDIKKLNVVVDTLNAKIAKLEKEMGDKDKEIENLKKASKKPKAE
jgi:outer membrane murein-binding lipoprotein Lpp